MKKIHKIIFIILLLIIAIIFLGTICYGFGIDDLTGDQTGMKNLKSTGNSIVRVALSVGSVVSVVMLIILGIKYMIGSTEEKAEYKKTLMPYLIGAGLVFAASSIAQMIYEMVVKM